ncbi:MAG: hypothetical protein IPL33_04650 [Sphingobacteriales bacterium]|nr:hypothetical protein [Sphingobacteriales bacterium]MCC7223372.1 hypothetical protein [Chitinophagales bacterium]
MLRHKKISSPATYRAARIRKLHFELSKEKKRDTNKQTNSWGNTRYFGGFAFLLGLCGTMLTTTIITITSAGYRLAEQYVTQV